MIAVSDAWRAAQNQILLPEMFVEVTYKITEPGAHEEAVTSGTYEAEFSDAASVTSTMDKNSEAYACLDYGCWGLDGSFGYFDGSPVDPGYVNRHHSTSDGGMYETQHPTITIEFANRRDVSIPGLTIKWSEVFSGWATDFIVTAYNSGGMVAQKTVRGNTSPISIVLMELVNYSRITIEILKWSHPYQRVRCIEITLGIQNVYTKTDLLGYDHNQTVDLLSAALPNNNITFKLRNDDNRWNPDNPTGMERYLTEQQEIRVRYGMDVNGTVEWIKGGTFWLSEWDTPANGLEVAFTARDAIGFMGGIYHGIRKGTLYDIAIAALTEADLPKLDSGAVRYFVDESLKNITTDFEAEDTEYIVSDVLQMVAHAGCCVFYQDRDGVVRIEPRSETYSGYMIGPEISFAHPEYTMSKPLRAVSVGYGNDYRSIVEVAPRGEVQTVDNELIVTEADALRVGKAAREILENRKVISGEFRADMRMDALDNVIVASKYASNIIAVTDIAYSTTGGAFRGKYTGRVVSIDLHPKAMLFSGDLYVGEI